TANCESVTILGCNNDCGIISTLRCCHGVCIDLIGSDPHNCGGCGITCAPSEICFEGTCTCTNGAIFCDGECVPISNDNCGSCGAVCTDCTNCVLSIGSGEYQCVSGCTAGQTCCSNGPLASSSCVNIQTDPNNCG